MPGRAVDTADDDHVTVPTTPPKPIVKKHDASSSFNVTDNSSCELGVLSATLILSFSVIGSHRQSLQMSGGHSGPLWFTDRTKIPRGAEAPQGISVVLVVLAVLGYDPERATRLVTWLGVPHLIQTDRVAAGGTMR